MLQGKNIMVLDLETQASASDCRHCGQKESTHIGNFPATCRSYYEPIGWDNHAVLGLSIGCVYDYATDTWGFFDPHTVGALIEKLVVTRPLLVTFNGVHFDCSVMAAVAQLNEEDDVMWHQYYTLEAYDILAMIWRQDPDRKFERGLNSLDAISVANGYGRKEMDGAEAPRRWREGRYAEVLTYCMGDVLKTRQLFEQIVATGQILRGDRRPITLPVPMELEDGAHA